MREDGVERFPAWGSRVVGVLGLVMVAVFVLLGMAGAGGEFHPAAYAVAGLVGVVLWIVVLRPAVSVRDEQLVLRNPLSTVRIPLAAIEQLAVRQWLAVRVGEHRFTNAGISRSRRQGSRDDRLGELTAADVASLSYGAIVERRIHKLAEDARSRHGIRPYSEEQEALAAGVRREWAWPEIVALAVLVVAVVVTMVI